ncbi:leucine--tRNA ligase [Candidatus Pacearchaeota archaeon]|nr:leucine--tRNA ligase [Candidatus Pacearchaeota archaeon]
MDFDFKKIEQKWQKRWENKKIFQVKESKKKKFYVLEMFPYPSASGLHMGHALNYTIGDIYVRFKRMQGFNVLYPMGFDALGLPAENAAIKAGEHPKPFTEKAIKNYVKQMKLIGLSYDWSKTLSTMDPEYYKWNQFWFLKFLEADLVYRKKAPVNWCPKCKTVLANEQVQKGVCWRHEDTEVEIKHLDQWYLKTTKYADELLDKVDGLEWPQKIKSMQKNWIGKSHGTEILFEIEGKKWPIFTTRPDTLFGVTFMVISAQHSELMSLVTEKQKKEVEKFLKKLKSTSEKDIEELEKEGVFTGSYARNPINGEEIPIWAGNFVVADYGSGMVMAVPGHDQRDFDFASKYKINIKEVIKQEAKPIASLSKNQTKGGNVKEKAYIQEGVLVNSKEFNGIKNDKAKEKITEFLKKKKLGKKVIQYKLRDWGFSRQRYWGTPIPIINCGSCGLVPVPEKDLPVKLPEKVKFGKGNPLETNEKWINVKCPKCKGDATREPDTMDTFFDSSWYFLRYPDNKNSKKPFDKTLVQKWLPVDQYIGGTEHACMHLIYARFFTKVLRDLGFLDFDEPFTKLFNQGMLKGHDGEKMSKSKGNVVLPEEVSKKYGIDAARLFLVSNSSPDKDIDWSEEGIQGSFKFIKKIVNYFEEVQFEKADARIESKINKTILEITEYLENFKYNLAVIKLRELFESLPEKTSKEVLENSLKLLNPFCPHITEELWEKLGNKNFLSLEKWSKANKKKINEFFEKQDLAISKLISDINQIFKLVKNKEKIYVYVLPNEKELYDEALINKISGRKISIFAVNDKTKYDPSNMSKKTKPGRPAIYLE